MEYYFTKSRCASRNIILPRVDIFHVQQDRACNICFIYTNTNRIITKHWSKCGFLTLRRTSAIPIMFETSKNVRSHCIAPLLITINECVMSGWLAHLASHSPLNPRVRNAVGFSWQIEKSRVGKVVSQIKCESRFIGRK